MKQYWRYFGFCLLSIFCSVSSNYAQEVEPQQEVNIDDLGNVSDEFQESFFEALKQKAITNHDKAVQALEKCVEIDPKPTFLYHELGKNYLALKKYDLAVKNFEKVLKERPKNKYVLEQLFETYYKQQNYDACTKVAEQLVTFEPLFKEQLSNLYFLQQRYDKALVTIESLIDELGSDTYRERLRKKIMLKLDNPSSQTSKLEKKIEENPRVEQNYINLIFLYSETKEDAKAFATAQKLLKNVPKSEFAHLALYKFYLNRGEVDKSIASMEIVLESDKIDVKSKQKVIKDFLEYVNQNPTYERALLKVIKKFSTISGGDKIFTEIGNYFYKNKKSELALDFYERGLKDNVSDLGILKKILKLQLEMGRYEKAQIGSEMALELYPSQPILYLTHGKALHQLGVYDKAIETLEIGMDYIIDDAEMESDFYDQLSELYTKKGDAVKATRYKEKSDGLKNKSQ